MARIFRALEKLDANGNKSGKFHYCVYSDEESWPPYPVGHCANGCPGHDTPEEARQHYQEYQFDQNMHYGAADEASKQKCCVCGDWTNGRAWKQGEFPKEFVLCDAHNNADSLRPVFFAKAVAAAVLLLAILFAADASACDRCGLFGNRCAFKQVQAVVHQPIYAQPYAVNYFVGQPIRVEALVEKSLRESPDYAEFQRFRLWKSTATGDPVAPSLPLTGEPALLIKTKCAICHTGDDAAGGLILDGSRAITDATYRRFSRMYVLSEKVPKKMQPLLDGLKDAEGSVILAELLRLEPTPATAADSEPGELK